MSQKHPTQALHSINQWSDPTILSSTITRSRLGTASKSGAAAGPQAMVTRASGWCSIKCASNPVDRMASPTRVDVMNRIFKSSPPPKPPNPDWLDP